MAALIFYVILGAAATSRNETSSTAGKNETAPVKAPQPEEPDPYAPISFICHDNGFTIHTRRNHSEGNRRYRGGDTTTVCESNVFNLDCGKGKTIRIIDAEYGRFDTTTCHSYPLFFMRCEASDAYNKVHQRCDNKQRCSIVSSAAEFGDPCPGIIKYLRVKHKCESVDPPRKLLSNTTCEKAQGFIECPAGKSIMVADVFYGRKDNSTCLSGNITNTNCSSSSALDVISARCDHRQNCTIIPGNDVFDDPCNGTSKYLQIDYQCVQDDLKYAVACQDSKMVLQCKNMSYINVVRAEYGRGHPYICNKGPQRIASEGCSSPNELAIMFGRCQGKDICEIPASSQIFGEPCPGKSKYLEVDYFCSDVYEESDSGGPPQVSSLKTDRVSLYSNKLNANNSNLYIAQLKDADGNEWQTVMDGEKEKFDFSEPHTIGGLSPDGFYDARIIKKKGIISSCLPFTRIRARKQ